MRTMLKNVLRYDWNVDEIESMLSLPLNDLLWQAQQAHRQYFTANSIQLSTLLSIKTGGCPEDCKYCSQSSRNSTDIDGMPMLEKQAVLDAAKVAKENGATRFCISAAFRSPKAKLLDDICAMISEIKAMDMETCATLGMLNNNQAQKLREAGLDYYNHNIDTSPDYYPEITTTRTFEDRLNTLSNVRATGMSVCSGGIIGMGETRQQRAGMLAELARMQPHPDSVPINLLVSIAGTPMENNEPLDELEFVRIIACARLLMPASYVRLSAGREQIHDSTQALCFFAGANSIFYGEQLLTTSNPQMERDKNLFTRLGLQAEQGQAHHKTPSSRRITS
ncbi:MAG: biotin synthase BioB [Mariprofundales bacterium]